MDDAGESVAQDLARPGLGDSNKVVSLKSDGEPLGLDRSGLREPGVANLLHDVVGEVPVLPPHDGVGAQLLALDDDDLILVPKELPSSVNKWIEWVLNCNFKISVILERGFRFIVYQLGRSFIIIFKI